MIYEFFVHGVPAPKGSARALRGTPFGKPCPKCRQQRRGFPKVFNANDNTKPWETALRGAARAAKAEKIEGAVKMVLEFGMPRPKSHYRTGKYSGLLKDSAPVLHTQKPDLDKLMRAVLDGLTDICFGDDAVVVLLSGQKFYSDTPGVSIQWQKAEECDLKMKRESRNQAELPGLAGTKT